MPQTFNRSVDVEPPATAHTKPRSPPTVGTPAPLSALRPLSPPNGGQGPGVWGPLATSPGRGQVHDDGKEVILTIRGIRDLPPNADNALTALRNPVVLVCLRARRLRTRVIDLSLNPVFNQYVHVSLREDPVVLVEVFDDDKSGDGMYGGVATMLLGSVMLTSDILGPAAMGKEKSLWLPLNVRETLHVRDAIPHILVSVVASDGLTLPSNAQPLIFVPAATPSLPGRLGSADKADAHMLSRESDPLFHDEDIRNLIEEGGRILPHAESKTPPPRASHGAQDVEDGGLEMIEGKSGLAVLGSLRGRGADKGGNGDVRGCSAMAVLEGGAVAVGFRDGSIDVHASWQPGSIAVPLGGHAAQVVCLAGITARLLMSGAADGSMSLWDAHARSCLTTLVAHSGAVEAMRLIPEPEEPAAGRALVVTGGDDWHVKVWHVRPEDAPGAVVSGVAMMVEAVAVLRRHSNTVSCLAACRPYMLSGSKDWTVCVWETKNECKCLLDLEGHDAPVVSLAALDTADSAAPRHARADPCEAFASLSADGALVIWETATWTALRKMATETSSALKTRQILVLGPRLYSVDAFGLTSWASDHETHAWARTGRLTIHKLGTRDDPMCSVTQASADPGGAAVLVANHSGHILVCAPPGQAYLGR